MTVAGPIKNAFILPGITGPTGLFEIVNILNTGPTNGTGATGDLPHRLKTYNQMTGPAGATGPTGTFKTLCYAGASGLTGKRTIIVPGYAGGGGGGGATTFDPATIGPGVLLSNNNLTATRSTGSGDQGAKGLASTMKSTGKAYFEYTWVNGTGGDTGAGVATAAATYLSLGAGGAGGALLYSSGAIWHSGNSGVALAAIANGNIVAVAVDTAANLIWFKNVTQAGNWNNSGTANPATGVGGITTDSVGLAVGPAVVVATNPAAFTLNPGPTFVGTVPVGFSAWG